ncbi:hypothetical protein AVEN_11843-1 [Araneus ventricosus]|uniref:Uncharacterized protein n=1 Tax=Araneus ventricosus TaxID=182803 RepID=A0A4Y2SGD3_ARAVE|nr:hypothetical protein AVEN_11843-1 [Araneus ventricosus]
MATTATSQPLPQEEYLVIRVEVTQPYTGIIVPTREVRTRRLIRQLLIPISEVLLGGMKQRLIDMQMEAIQIQFPFTEVSLFVRVYVIPTTQKHN